jgi:hypothetical protein
MDYIDLKYIKFLPLEQFTDKGDHKFNFRCPICGDSQRSSTKKRCWAFDHQNTMFIKCFNCDYSNSFQFFLKNEFPHFYPDYLKEKFSDKGYTPKKQTKVDLFASEYDSLTLQAVNHLPPQHKAVQFLRKRCITPKMSETFYYSDNFSLWINEEIEEGGINFEAVQDRRIVIPFYTKHKKIFAVQGRTIDNADPKYITFKMDKGAGKIFGLDLIDFSKTVYVVEGPLDSLFLDNCLAVGGALGEVESLLSYTTKENIVIVPDNDRRNKQTDKFILQAIEKGFNIVIWDKAHPFKDINEAVEFGLTIEEISRIIKQYTVKGLMATTKFRLKR